MAAHPPPDSQPVNKLQILWAVAVAATVVGASSRGHVAAPSVTNIDKVAHFMVYGLLGTLVARVGRGWSGALTGLVAASLFGVTDEWHQSFVPGRSSDINDWIADTTGAALAVSLYAGWPAYRWLLELPLWPRPRRPVAP